MKNYLLLFGIVLCFSCTSTIDQNSSIKETSTANNTQNLNLSLNVTHPTFKLGMPVTVRIILKNNSSEKATFCKLNSPVDKENLTNCFEVKDEQGNAIAFVGTTEKYFGAIEEKDHITIDAGATQIYWADLRMNYQIDKAGTYQVRFVGDTINKLPNSSPVNVVLIDK